MFIFVGFLVTVLGGLLALFIVPAALAQVASRIALLTASRVMSPPRAHLARGALRSDRTNQTDSACFVILLGVVGFLCAREALVELVDQYPWSVWLLWGIYAALPALAAAFWTRYDMSRAQVTTDSTARGTSDDPFIHVRELAVDEQALGRLLSSMTVRWNQRDWGDRIELEAPDVRIDPDGKLTAGGGEYRFRLTPEYDKRVLPTSQLAESNGRWQITDLDKPQPSGPKSAHVLYLDVVAEALGPKAAAKERAARDEDDQDGASRKWEISTHSTTDRPTGDTLPCVLRWESDDESRYTLFHMPMTVRVFS